jgi:hypothetical protein
MELVIDPDVKAVAEFMQGSVPAVKLRSVASAVAALAPIIWSRHESDPIEPLFLTNEPWRYGPKIGP